MMRKIGILFVLFVNMIAPKAAVMDSDSEVNEVSTVAHEVAAIPCAVACFRFAPLVFVSRVYMVQGKTVVGLANIIYFPDIFTTTQITNMKKLPNLEQCRDIIESKLPKGCSFKLSLKNVPVDYDTYPNLSVAKRKQILTMQADLMQASVVGDFKTSLEAHFADSLKKKSMTIAPAIYTNELIPNLMVTTAEISAAENSASAAKQEERAISS